MSDQGSGTRKGTGARVFITQEVYEVMCACQVVISRKKVLLFVWVIFKKRERVNRRGFQRAPDKIDVDHTINDAMRDTNLKYQMKKRIHNQMKKRISNQEKKGIVRVFIF